MAPVSLAARFTASVSNVETQPEIIWSSSDENIATVDSNGKVKGVNVGRVVIFAQAEVEGEVLEGDELLLFATIVGIQHDYASYVYPYEDA